MNALLLGLFLLMTFLAPTSLIAGPYDFKCVTTTASILNDEGVLESDKEFQSLSKPFVVDRETGRVTGGLLDNGGTQILLVDKGSSQQSFKVHAHTSTRVVHAMYLQINEFVSGPRKPFMGIRSPNSVVITGICE
jgi:hypothetical protein